jgi:hypothetical protein
MKLTNITTYSKNKVIGNSIKVVNSFIDVDVPSAGGIPRLYDVWGSYGWPALAIIPNPSEGDVEIRAVKNPEEEFKLELTDINGQILKTLYHGKTNDEVFSGIMNTDDLTPGVYFIILHTPWQATAKQLYIIR